MFLLSPEVARSGIAFALWGNARNEDVRLLARLPVNRAMHSAWLRSWFYSRIDRHPRECPLNNDRAHRFEIACCAGLRICPVCVIALTAIRQLPVCVRLNTYIDGLRESLCVARFPEALMKD
jgi:hypothetical protein